jgi:hypothetical protein
MIDRKGAVVILAACSEGRGYHALAAEVGAPLFSNFGDTGVWQIIGKRTVGLFSPNVNWADVIHLFPDSVLFKKNFGELIAALEDKYGTSPAACVLPCSLTLP